MSRTHQWHRAGMGYACRDCSAIYDGTDGVCLAVAALQRRIAALAIDARDTDADLRRLRQDAAAGTPTRALARYLQHEAETAARAAYRMVDYLEKENLT